MAHPYRALTPPMESPPTTGATATGEPAPGPMGTSNQPLVIQVQSPASSSESTMTVVPLLFLHDGTTMLIPPDAIPNPPAFRIQQGMQGIVDLNARWDDHPDHSGGKSHLRQHFFRTPMVSKTHFHCR